MKYFGTNENDGFNFYEQSEKDKLIMEAAKHMSREEIQKELKHARDIFMKYDENHSGYLEKDEVAPMMIDTYKVMNTKYSPSEKDVIKYISMMDTDKDGKISLEEYEIFVLKALKNRNINF